MLFKATWGIQYVYFVMLQTQAIRSYTSLYNSLIHHFHLNLMQSTPEMFSLIIHAEGSIHLCIAQSVAMSVSCLISHLTVPDLNTSAAVCLHFLLIYHRQHCNPPSFHFHTDTEISPSQPNLIQPWSAVTVAITATAETTTRLRFSLKVAVSVVGVDGDDCGSCLLFFHCVDTQDSLYCSIIKSNATTVMCNIYEHWLWICSHSQEKEHS